MNSEVLPQPCILRTASHEGNCLVSRQTPLVLPLERTQISTHTILEHLIDIKPFECYVFFEV